jgi:hypothetical protein
MPLFAVGDLVDRIENREVTKAIIITVQEHTNHDDDVCYELQYEEGGTGWWPEQCLKSFD